MRKAEQLEGLDGLIIPGGESTAITRLMRLYGIEDAIRRFRGPVFGTCAGMILLDRDHLGLVDVAVEPQRLRAPGRELRGRPGARGRGRAAARRLHPRAARAAAGPDVEVLAEHEGEPVLLRDGRFLVASFHPELTDDTRVHERFLQLVEEERYVGSQ